MNILLIDDEPLVGLSLTDFIQDNLGHTVVHCTTPEEALTIFKQQVFDLVITDLCMPSQDGLSVINSMHQSANGYSVDYIIITAYGSKENAIKAIRTGVTDFFEKPIDITELTNAIEKINKRRMLESEPAVMKTEESSIAIQRQQVRKSPAYVFKNIPDYHTIYFFSDTMKRITHLIKQFHEDRSIPILVTGETGVGKEIIARLIHYFKDEQEQSPFISINCTAISPFLFESELFGYESGSFTGAKKSGMKGKFELAQGGTLFLDEIGDMPLELQPKLLRALQEREIYRIGGQVKIKLDVRIVCSTNKNIGQLVNEGKFRSDLFYRLNAGVITIPPLRDRKEIISFLGQAFLDDITSAKGRHSSFLTKETIEYLQSYNWPGNIRELHNAIELVVILYDDVALLPEHFHFLKTKKADSALTFGKPLLPGTIMLPENTLPLAEIEKEIIVKALDKFDGNKTKTAEYLGITRSELRTKLNNINT